MQRALEAYQELGFVLLFLFLGVFVYQTDSRGLCVATTIVLLLCLSFISALFFIKQLLATWYSPSQPSSLYFALCSMIRNVIKEATAFHWAVGFGFPLVAAAISTVGLNGRTTGRMRIFAGGRILQLSGVLRPPDSAVGSSAFLHP